MKFFKNKKILIAGGTGLIGTFITNYLCLSNAKVTCISVDSKSRVNKVLTNPNVFKRVDLRNNNLCKEITKEVDIVINLMGVRESTQLGVKQSATSLSAFLRCNTNLIENSCLNRVGTYLFCGSINQYPPLRIRREEDVWNGLPSAQDKYVGISKRVGEMEAEAYSIQFEWDAVKIIRPSNVYGPFDNFDPATAHVIPSLIHKAFSAKNDFIEVAGNGSAVRDFIYVEDLVRGILLMIKKGKTNYPVNIGSGKGVSIKKIVQVINSNLVNKKKIIWNTNLPTGDSKRVLDIKRAEKHLSFNTKFPIEKGIKETMKWYKKNLNLAYNLGRTYDKVYKI